MKQNKVLLNEERSVLYFFGFSGLAAQYKVDRNFLCCRTITAVSAIFIRADDKSISVMVYDCVGNKK